MRDVQQIKTGASVVKQDDVTARRRSDGRFQSFQGLYLLLGLQHLLVGTGSDEAAVGVTLHELVDVLLINTNTEFRQNRIKHSRYPKNRSESQT